ncbi:MAG: elongation factor P [Puniceicoccales bacterium]|jgi:elongation factor P|nr:elongation factor P [Puniceicoccales bacterium]
MANTPVNNIRKKNVVRYNGDICLVLECLIRTPPNNASYCQMELRSLASGRVIPVRTNIGASFETLENSTAKLELSYEADGSFVFANPTTFEETYVPRTLIEESAGFLVPGQSYEVMFVDGKPVAVNLPGAVEIKVVEAPPAIKGDTSGNVLKPVILETGLSVNVPLFIKEGEIIRVSTEDKSYLGRA